MTYARGSLSCLDSVCGRIMAHLYCGRPCFDNLQKSLVDYAGGDVILTFVSSRTSALELSVRRAIGLRMLPTSSISPASLLKSSRTYSLSCHGLAVYRRAQSMEGGIAPKLAHSCSSMSPSIYRE
jgi:hypothetical protein